MDRTAPFPRPLAAVLIVLFVALVVTSLVGCSSRVQAKPGIGVGVEHRADGGRVGFDLGEFDIGGSASHPATGEAPCVGPECAVPGAPPTRAPFRVEMTPTIPAAVWVVLAAVLVGLGGIGYLTWRNGRPATGAKS